MTEQRLTKKALTQLRRGIDSQCVNSHVRTETLLTLDAYEAQHGALLEALAERSMVLHYKVRAHRHPEADQQGLCQWGECVKEPCLTDRKLLSPSGHPNIPDAAIAEEGQDAHEFEGIVAGTPDRDCTRCGRPDRDPIHTQAQEGHITHQECGCPIGEPCSCRKEESADATN